MRKGVPLRGARGTRKPLGLPTREVRIDRVELAWAAGFFDGEGSTFATKRGHLRVSITQASPSGIPDVLLRFHAAVGAIGYVYGPVREKNPSAQPKWFYMAHGFEMGQTVLGLIWTWLGPVKREQAAAALATARARCAGRRYEGARFGRPLNDVCKRGHSYDDAYVRGHQRSCRSCAKLRYRALRSARAKVLEDGPVDTET